MKIVTITPKDITKYKLAFSASGEVIDELAYCAKQWTSEDLCNENIEYEPNEPYNFNYEADLFEATKTHPDLCNISRQVGYDGNLPSLGMCIENGTKLQAGAFMALNFPDLWAELLELYTEKLKEDRFDSISKAYILELEKAIDSFYDDQEHEWLYGDRSNYAGVIYEIAKYFTDERKGSYDKKADEYTFTLNENDIEKAKDEGYNKSQLKGWILDNASQSGDARRQKETDDREKRKIERERIAKYKAEQKAKAEEERKQKLLSMILK